MKTELDVVVLGGGPAGCAAATLLAQRGRRVTLLESRSFPRFRVGESLIPAVNLTLDKIGIGAADMARFGFPVKQAVQFYSPEGKASRPFYFDEVDDPRYHSTWQVLRSDFDAMLAENAAKHGVEVRTDAPVAGIVLDGEAVTGVTVRNEDGPDETVGARVVVDASGLGSILAKQLGNRQTIAGLENAAIFSHYRGVRLDPGRDAGTTIVYRLGETSWIWFIPLPDDKVSIGLVAPARELAARSESSTEILDLALASCAPLAERLQGAERTMEVKAARDFTYRAQREGGPGWCLIGDALGFIDPVYSSGLFLAARSAEIAADAVHAALERDDVAHPDLTGYAPAYHEAFNRFLALVQAFYRPSDVGFARLAKNDTYRAGLTDLLIGRVDSSAAGEVAQVVDELCGSGSR